MKLIFTSNRRAELLTRLLGSFKFEIGGPIGTNRGKIGFKDANLKYRDNKIKHDHSVLK